MQREEDVHSKDLEVTSEEEMVHDIEENFPHGG